MRALVVVLGLIGVVGGAVGENLLWDNGFELSSPNGKVPSSGAWSADYIGQAGSVCTNTSAHDGVCGLWSYTGNAASDYFSGAYQIVDVTAGESYHAFLWVRPVPASIMYGGWVANTTLRLVLRFINANDQEISRCESAARTDDEYSWSMLEIAEVVAPAGTERIHFVCEIKKPSDATGIAVCNFDDCFLEELPTADRLTFEPPVVGLGFLAESAVVQIKNDGDLATNYTMASSGMDTVMAGMPPGGVAAHSVNSVTVSINRALLGAELSYRGSVACFGAASTAELTVLAEKHPGYAVPSLPADISISGRQLLFRRRQADGSTGPLQYYIVDGFCWSPAGVGTTGDNSARREEFGKWYETDIQLMHDLGCNTVYTFLDLGSGALAQAILDYLYYNGIMAIVTVDLGVGDLSNLTATIEAWKSHPAILAWAIGNEWNINLFHGKFQTLGEAAAFCESVAALIKTLDTAHPVVSVYGELELEGVSLETSAQIVNSLCPTVDIWGLNCYRGDNFGDLFEKWSSIASKPMVLTEFGADSYYTTTLNYPISGYEDESKQANFIANQLADIAPELSAIYPATGCCLGGTVFEFSDEWWKVKAEDGGSMVLQDNGGFFTTSWNPYAQPDGCANEEYFGLFRIDRRPKKAVELLAEYFRAHESVTAVSAWRLY